MAIETKPFKVPNGLEVGGTDGIVLPQGTTSQRPTNFTGTFVRFNTTTNVTEIGVDGEWSEIGGGGIHWNDSTLTGTANIITSGGYFIDTRDDEVRVQLPSNPSLSTDVAFLDLHGTFSNNNLVIEPPSGTTIMGIEQPLTINTNNQCVILTYSGDTSLGWRITSAITTNIDPEPEKDNDEFEQYFTNAGLSVWSRGNTVTRKPFGTFVSRDYGPDQVLVGGDGQTNNDIICSLNSETYNGNNINTILVTGDLAAETNIKFGKFVINQLGNKTLTFSVVFFNKGSTPITPSLLVSLTDNDRTIVESGIVNDVALDEVPGNTTSRLHYTFTMPPYSTAVHHQNLYVELRIPGRDFTAQNIHLGGWNLTNSDRLLDLIIPNLNQDTQDCINFREERVLFRGNSSYNVGGIQRHYKTTFAPKFKHPTLETNEPNPPTAFISGSAQKGFDVAFDPATTSISTYRIIVLKAEI